MLLSLIFLPCDVPYGVSTIAPAAGSKQFCQPYVSAVKWLITLAAYEEPGSMTLQMPEADGAVLARRDKIVAALRQIVPGEGVIAGEREMRPFETDGLTAYHQLPMVVVLPETTEQVAAVLRYCYDEGIRVVPLAVGRRTAAGRWRAARHGQVQPHP
jgi:hypothetical protein